MIKNTQDKHLSKQGKLLRFIFFLIIGALYSISAIFLAYGFLVLVIIVIFGGINIQNGQIIALGILLFFPLRYLKNRLDKEDFSSLVHRKEK